jgi:hypothetical protein
MSATLLDTDATLPIPLLVHAPTGKPALALPAESLPHLSGDLPGAEQRSIDSTHLGTDSSVGDPDDLTQTGWCILFASDADPAIKAQLQPLIDLRRKQVNDDHLFQVFAGDESGVRLNQTADDWAEYRGVSLTAKVDPTAGVPYYVLLVGHPDRIPFEFQNLLKMQWAVGRLAFDDIEDYGRYAQAVVEYEDPSFLPIQRKNAAVWVTRNQGDVATAMLSNAICPNFLDEHRPLGSGAAKFTLDAFTYTSQRQATKQQLIDILRGDLPGGPPAVLFTGSHGAEYPVADPALRSMQGRCLPRTGSATRPPAPTTCSLPKTSLPTPNSRAPWPFSSPAIAAVAPLTTTTISTPTARRSRWLRLHSSRPCPRPCSAGAHWRSSPTSTWPFPMLFRMSPARPSSRRCAIH